MMETANDQLLEGYVYFDGFGRKTRTGQVEASRSVYVDSERYVNHTPGAGGAYSGAPSGGGV